MDSNSSLRWWAALKCNSPKCKAVRWVKWWPWLPLQVMRPLELPPRLWPWRCRCRCILAFLAVLNPHTRTKRPSRRCKSSLKRNRRVCRAQDCLFRELEFPPTASREATKFCQTRLLPRTVTLKWVSSAGENNCRFLIATRLSLDKSKWLFKSNLTRI